MRNYGIITGANEMPRRAGNTRGVAPEHWRFTMQDHDTPNNNLIPYGYCHCGCGNKTNLVKQTNKSRGVRAGEPRKYIRDHRPRVTPPASIWSTSDNCYLIPLTRGKCAMVDADDEPVISQYKWHAVKMANTWYAMRKDGHKGQTIPMHRQILNPPSDMLVDHRNFNGLDNRRGNIRICTKAENQRNRHSPPISNTSGFMGVTFVKKTGKWMAQIGNQGKNIHLGFHRCPIEAAIARDIAALHLQGEFAYLNFPELREVFA